MASITRKGITGISLVVGIILVVVATLTMLYILGVFGNGVTVEKDICKKSVWANDLVDIKGMRFADLDINCPTQDIMVRKGKEDQEVNKLFAKSLYDCWDQYYEGKLSIFDKDGVYCAVCSRISFEDGFDRKNPRITGLFDYLASNKIPSGGMTYLSFLQGYESESSDWLLGKISEKTRILPSDSYSLDPKKEYATIFVYVKGKDNMRIAMDLAKNAINARGSGIFLLSGVVVLAGAANVFSGGFLVPFLGGVMVSSIMWTSGAVVGTQMVLRTDMDYDHMAFIALRDFDETELNKLKCDILVGN